MAEPVKSPSSLPRTSVALCTYNGARYLDEQLQSIAGQTQPVDELILCDDGSTDDTILIAERFAQNSRIAVRILCNSSRLGVTRNFEKAMSLCTGGIILLCDQDDVWRSDKAAQLTKALQNTGAAMAFSNAQVVRHDLQPAGYRLWESIWFDGEEQRRVASGDALPVLLRHAVAAGSTLAMRSEFLSLLLPIPNLPHCHDVWITLLLACVGRIAPVDQDLIQYRLHSGNIVGIRRYNLLGQIRMAKMQIKSNAFAHLAELYSAAYERLSTQRQWSVDESNLRLLQDKIQHSRLRHDLPRRWLRRLGIIRSELRRGNYLKYSYGYKSVLQDLFLR